MRSGDGRARPADLRHASLVPLDHAVIGISGIEPNGPLLDFDLEEVRATQTIIARAETVYPVADQTKSHAGR